jgi:hypothetical protein
MPGMALPKLGAVMLLGVLATPALADVDESTRIAADALFEDAKALLAKGDTARACEKFAASQKKMPRPGTFLNLADCHEREGRTATAWAEFRSAATSKEDPARADFAKQRAAALQPNLTRLLIEVPAKIPGDLVVTSDGKVFDPALFGTAIPVDPGKHKVAASAKGFAEWSTEIDVQGKGKTITVIVPELSKPEVVADPKPEDVTPTEPEPDGIKPVPATPDEGPGGPAPIQRNLGIGLIVGGGVGVGIGSWLALSAKSQYDDAHAPGGGCDAQTHCSAAGYEAVDAAHSKAAIATVVFVASGVAAATGIVLVLTAPKGGRSVSLVPTGNGFALAGEF